MQLLPQPLPLRSPAPLTRPRHRLPCSVVGSSAILVYVFEFGETLGNMQKTRRQRREQADTAASAAGSRQRCESATAAERQSTEQRQRAEQRETVRWQTLITSIALLCMRSDRPLELRRSTARSELPASPPSILRSSQSPRLLFHLSVLSGFVSLPRLALSPDVSSFLVQARSSACGLARRAHRHLRGGERGRGGRKVSDGRGGADVDNENAEQTSSR